MVRVLLDQFPKGYYKRQKADGFAIDAGLHRATQFIRHAAHKYSMLGVIVVCGDPGTGKSTLYSQLAKIVDPECNLDNTHFSVVDFCESIGKSERVDRVQVQADDEATDLMSRSALESGNKKVLITLARMRSKKIVVFLMLPSFFDLDRTIAMFYTKMVVRCFNRGQLHRGYFDAWLGNKAVRELYLNGKKTYSYYKPKPNLKGRFSDCFCFDYVKYCDKKDAALLKMSAKETYASNRFKKQRDLLIKYTYEQGKLTQKAIGELIGGLDHSEVGKILSNVR
jgi:energy-coupling factor transporter ATP-binding protein EcfA2